MRRRGMGCGWRTAAAVAVAVVAAGPLLHLVWASMGAGGGGAAGAWAEVLASRETLRAAAASLMLASAQTLAGVTLASMAAYGLVFGGERWRRWGRWVVVAIMALVALPPPLLLPGGFELVVWLGLFDSWWAVVVPGSLNLLAVLLYRAAFVSVPRELIEAARVDGCSELRAWRVVAMPVVAPTTAACLILSFAGAWNAVVWPTVVLQDPSLRTLPMVVATLAAGVRSPAEEATLAAYAVVGMLPLASLFLLLQRDFLPVLHAGRPGG